MFGQKRVYMDYAAAAPLLPEAERAMRRAERLFGNPSASHTEGRAAYDVLRGARKDIATSLSVKPDELVFVSGGTEANNLAITGLVEGLRARAIPYEQVHIVTSSIEHSSVEKTLSLLEGRGVSVTRVRPDESGIISAGAVLSALRENTALITLAHVNSETGVIMPFSDIARAVAGTATAFSKVAPECKFPVVHADAAQSPLYLDASPHTLGAALVSYDAQKIGGPKGVGILYRDFSVPMVPVMGGGTQERSVRPGTENVSAIAGAGVAFRLAKEGRKEREARVRALRDELIALITSKVPDARLIGDRKRRIANNALFAIPGIDGDYLAILMDERGIAVTPRSACLGTGAGISNVVMELTHDEALARGTIRFSLGPGTTKGELHRTVLALVSSLPTARARAA